MSEPGRARQIECARVSEPGCEPEPGSELESLKVSLRASFRASKVSFRVTLGPNLGCQSQPRQCDLENIDFP